MKYSVALLALVAGLCSADVCMWCSDDGNSVNEATAQACHAAYPDQGGPTVITNPDGTNPSVVCGPAAANDVQEQMADQCNRLGHGMSSEQCSYFSGKRRVVEARQSTVQVCCQKQDEAASDVDATIDICEQIDGDIKGFGLRCEIPSFKMNQFFDACITEYDDGASSECG